jgi:hypothetical protein
MTLFKTQFQDATTDSTVRVREDLLRMAQLGGQALESDEITATEEIVERLGDKYQEMADAVVRVKATYIDAMINWGVQLMHYEDISDQLAAIKRELFSFKFFNHFYRVLESEVSHQRSFFPHVFNNFIAWETFFGIECLYETCWKNMKNCSGGEVEKKMGGKINH